MQPKGEFIPAASRDTLRNRPQSRVAFWRQAYNQSAERLDPALTFMNLGCADGEESAPPPAEGKTLIRVLSEGLYRATVDGADLRGRDILEAGCGLGGGSDFLMEAYAPRTLTAIDAAERAVARCRARFTRKGLTFRQADAAALPVADGSMDAAINVESSHCYPSRSAFFAEVQRVLRPGGLFLFADCLMPEVDGMTLDEVNETLARAGFETDAAEDIGARVLLARQWISASPICRGLLCQGGSASRNAAAEAFFLEGSQAFADLQAGRISYWRWRLRRSGRWQP